MKTAIGSVVAALAASTCCIGPVVLSAIGAGALGAAASKLAVYRPWLLGLTTVLLGGAFYAAYRPDAAASCEADGACHPTSRRAARIVLWVVTAIVLLLVTFPYYVNPLV